MIKAYEKEMEQLTTAGQYDVRFVPGSDWEAPLPPEEEEASSDLKQIVADPIPKKTQVWIAAVDLFVAGDMKVNGSRENQSLSAYAAAAA